MTEYILDLLKNNMGLGIYPLVGKIRLAKE